MAETTTAAPPKRTHCPNCGAKIHRQDMSNCLYCAMPFDFVEKAEEQKRPSALQARLKRMREHADFEVAAAWVPPAEEDLERGPRAIRWGLALVALGGLLLLWGATGEGLGWGRLLLGVALAAPGVNLLVKGMAVRRERMRLPLLKRPALVSDRRSETSLGWMDGKTVYYFQLEMEDGGGEFRYPGRGTQDDLLVKGLTGLAYTRGDVLLAFKTIKV
jgi:hypothetical protein